MGMGVSFEGRIPVSKLFDLDSFVEKHSQKTEILPKKNFLKKN